MTSNVLIGYVSDTASVYRNEADIGRALKILLPEHGLSRNDIFITSKLGTESLKPFLFICCQMP